MERAEPMRGLAISGWLRVAGKISDLSALSLIFSRFRRCDHAASGAFKRILSHFTWWFGVTLGIGKGWFPSNTISVRCMNLLIFVSLLLSGASGAFERVVNNGSVLLNYGNQPSAI